MAASSSPNIGIRLREAREQRGLTLQQIAASTRISVASLDALERNLVGRLPGGIFTRAFVRAYAVEVGLDPEQTVREFLDCFPDESGTAAGLPGSDARPGEAFISEPRRVGTWLQVVGFSVAILLVLTYLNFRGWGTSVRRPPSGPSSSSGSATRPQSRSPTVPARPADAARIESVPAHSQPVGTSLPEGLTIGIASERPCWISVTEDGEPGLSRLLQAGDRVVVRARTEVVLTVGDAGALAVTINGVRARPLGGGGEVVAARINAQNYRSFLPPS